MSHWACGIWLYSALTGCPEYTPYSTCVPHAEHHHHDSVPDSHHDGGAHHHHHPPPTPKERPDFDSDYKLPEEYHGGGHHGGAEFE